MHSVVGVFSSREAADVAANSLDLPADRVSVVAPGPREPEDQGIGSALGGVVGGAVGAAAGSSLGTAAASLLLPGVGPVIATGVIAAMVLGAGGAVVGASAGGNLEEASDPDPAHDPRDRFFYHEALRRGRAMVLALADTPERAREIRGTLARHGAESLESTRESWWREIRDREIAGYEGDFAVDENEYRRGFEDALSPDNQGKPLDDPEDHSPAYRKGYTRGCEHFRRLV